MTIYHHVRFIALTVIFAGLVSRAEARRDKEPVLAMAAADPALCARLRALGPGVNPGEAERVAFTAFTTGRDLAREWQVVWPPGLQNFLVNRGLRKGGLCFQWAAELLVRLDALHLQTLEFHWAESYPNTLSEHNVIVITARDRPLHEGILLDNWRHLGHLCWGPVSGDPQYEWKENKAEATRRLRERHEQLQRAAKLPSAQRTGKMKKETAKGE